ncbi:MAG: GspE/PulE family protein [Planctomycetota bacterium]
MSTATHDETHEANEPKTVSAATAAEETEAILAEAGEQMASDVHLQWLANGVMVRFRVTGLLEDHRLLDVETGKKVISHLKVLGNLNIADRRRPQDGRVIFDLGGRQLDLRLATVPTLYGENLTMRVFDRGAAFRNLDELGMEPSDLDRVKHLLHSPHGLILVTGPTGAGKTTSLYAFLESLNHPSKNILTVEDPIEYDIDRVNQIAVNRKLDLGFAECLRSSFRHDPDIIMIGEIRDAESARIAVRASLSGHLVFSTIHTGHALGAFDTLVQLGVSPYLASSALLGVVTQQLVRRICPHCRERFEFPVESLNPREREEFRQAMESEGGNPSFAVGIGCDECRHSGFAGRTGLFEVLEATPHVRQAMASGAPRQELEKRARQAGWRSLQLAGFCKIVQGETTIEEVLRVVPVDDEEMRHATV